ncbi:hypothetical protein B0G83_1238 [Paraburkholderia sp. BL21I4N1]|nr:hypothetical protein B0G83_1238 [Paraburkholderia sp. BL21I4N1]
MQPARPTMRAKTPRSLITMFPLSLVVYLRLKEVPWFATPLQGILSAGYR